MPLHGVTCTTVNHTIVPLAVPQAREPWMLMPIPTAADEDATAFLLSGLYGCNAMQAAPAGPGQDKRALSVAVLPPVFGPVMMTQRVSGRTHTSTGTGGTDPGSGAPSPPSSSPLPLLSSSA